MYGVAGPPAVLRAGIAGHDHVDADGQADEQADEQIVERAHGADGGQRFIAGEAADDDGIRGVEDQLEDAGEHDGQGEEEHLGEERSFRHIHGAVRVRSEHDNLLNS